MNNDQQPKCPECGAKLEYNGDCILKFTCGKTYAADGMRVLIESDQCKIITLQAQVKAKDAEIAELKDIAAICSGPCHGSKGDDYISSVKKLKAELAATKAKLPKYQPEQVVYPSHRRSYLTIPKEVAIRYIVTHKNSITYADMGGKVWRESDLHPTQETAQAAIDKENGK